MLSREKMENRIRRTSWRVDPEIQEAKTFYDVCHYFTNIRKSEYKAMRLRQQVTHDSRPGGHQIELMLLKIMKMNELFKEQLEQYLLEIDHNIQREKETDIFIIKCILCMNRSLLILKLVVQPEKNKVQH